MGGMSDFERLAALPDAARERVLAGLNGAAAQALEHDWEWLARPEQLAPEGSWRIWLMMAGRGFGKTRAGAEWVRRIAENDGAARIALVGATLGEARSVMVEGPSGLLSIAPWWNRPIFSPALRRLVWPNGAMALLFGAADPESLRGPQFSHGWADEIAKWPQGEAAWDNMMMGMRLGRAPQVMATTTPRPVPLVRGLVARDGVDVAVTRGRTADNVVNLAEGFVAAMEQSYGATRLGRQELDGELIEEVEGALWNRELLERCRVAHVPGGGDRAAMGGPMSLPMRASRRRARKAGRGRWHRRRRCMARTGSSPKPIMAERWWRACCARRRLRCRCGWFMPAGERRRGPSLWRRCMKPGGSGIGEPSGHWRMRCAV